MIHVEPTGRRQFLEALGAGAAAQPVLDRHQALMWQVGDLMHQWEELQSLSDRAG